MGFPTPSSIHMLLFILIITHKYPNGRLLGVSDQMCVDLDTFERIPHNDQLAFDEIELKPGNLGEIESQLTAKTNNLPIVCVIEAHRVDTNTLARLYLCDLGGSLVIPDQAQQKNSISHSLSALHSFCLNVQSNDHVIEANKYPLTAILSELLFGGSCRISVLLDIIEDGSIRGLANGLSLVECLKELRSCVKARKRDPLPDLYNSVQDALDTEREERRSAQSTLKSVRKQLDRLQKEKAELEQIFNDHRSSSELERFEYEYRVTCLELEMVHLRDSLRTCQLEGLRAEGEACKHGLQSAELVEMSLVARRQVDNLESTLISVRADQETMRECLEGRVEASQSALNAAQAESKRLAGDLSTAHADILRLNEELTQAAKKTMELRDKQEAASPVLKAQEREIDTLRKQLDTARAAEERLNAMLQKSDARADAHRHLLSDLERQMEMLRMENNQLRNVSMSTKQRHEEDQSQVTSALAKMESEWRAEREAMHRLLQDFKQTQQQKPPAAIGRFDNVYGDDEPLDAVEPSYHKIAVSSKPKPKAAEPKPPKEPKKQIEKAIEKQPAAEPKEPKKKPEPKATVKPNNKQQEPAPLASILPPAKPNQEQERKSPIKLWKPASFLPNLSKRPAAAAGNDPSENRSILANLTFTASTGKDPKRVKLPSTGGSSGKQQSEGVPIVGNQAKPSIFRSSANPLSTDPTLLPSIIANFNVKIPPKK